MKADSADRRIDEAQRAQRLSQAPYRVIYILADIFQLKRDPFRKAEIAKKRFQTNL
jgi:hypothetical protein